MAKLKIHDYLAIAHKTGLEGRRADLYAAFMLEAFPTEADALYAAEWAGRFKRGVEFNAADSQRRDIITRLTQEIIYK